MQHFTRESPEDGCWLISLVGHAGTSVTESTSSRWTFHSSASSGGYCSSGHSICPQGANLAEKLVGLQTRSDQHYRLYFRYPSTNLRQTYKERGRRRPKLLPHSTQWQPRGSPQNCCLRTRDWCGHLSEANEEEEEEQIFLK